MIDIDLEPAQAPKTALHEAAHVILHSDQEPTEYIAHPGEREIEAESTAYVVAGLLGLDTSTYSIGHVAAWTNADTNLTKTTATNVLRAAHQLAEAHHRNTATSQN